MLIKISERLFLFITNLQDEVHKTAIEYHRKIRDKEMIKSKLDYIDGIGDKKRDALLKHFGSINKIKEATIEEIAKELNVEKEDIIISLDAIQDPISLQEPVYNESSENIYVMDQVKDNKNTDELWAENITIAEAMKKLNEREKNIITRRIFDGKTQMEVAEEIGISQAQVSRLEKNAIERIKRMYK